jgi:LacI family transcriptional regulator
MKRNPRPTIREVAKLARVGLMTVSRVINNHPSVRSSTRKKVETAIAQLGYQQNEAARLMKGQRAKVIGLIVPDLSDIFFASCAHTVQQIARRHGYMTLVVSSERDPDLEVEQAQLMANRMISGLLVATSTRKGDDRLQNLRATGLAIVAFDRPLPSAEVDAVLVENRAGAEEAVQHLVEHGHKRIACVGYDEAVYTVNERIQGYIHCMNSAGLKPQIFLSLLHLEDMRRWLTEILALKNRPTAIFSLNHRTSTFLLQALAESNIGVPDEMAMIGFDDFDLASVVRPPLTVVTQSPVELARRAMDLLVNSIGENKNGTEPSSPSKVLLPARLVVRGSCGTHRSKTD